MSNFVAPPFDPEILKATPLTGRALNHMRDHLQTIAGRDPRDVEFQFTAIMPKRKLDGKDVPLYRPIGDRTYSVTVGTPRKALLRLRQYHAAGYGLFVLVQEHDGGFRRKFENITGSRCIWGEQDEGERITNWPIEPTLTIESSAGNSHYYWSIDPADPLDLDTADLINKGLARTYGMDDQARDRSRVMRLAGTCNTKPGKGDPVRVIGGSKKAYRASELLEAFPPAEPDPVDTDISDRSDRTIGVREHGLDHAQRRRVEAYAASALTRATSDLSGLTDGQSRVQTVYRIACRLGSWVHHGILDQAVAEQELMAAYGACGALRDHGKMPFVKALRKAWARSARDPLALPTRSG